MRIGIAAAALAIGFMAARAAQAQDASIESQMRGIFEVCADFTAGRLDRAGAVAAAHAVGFEGDGGRAMTWPAPGAAAQVRFSLAPAQDRWCSLGTADTGVDARALSDQAMSWAAGRLPGPWRHARADAPATGDVYAITGFNGRISVSAAQPPRGGARVMVMNHTAAQWNANVARLGAQAVTLDTPAFVPPPPPAAPVGPPLRDTVLSALNQCRTFVTGGPRPDGTDTAPGVRLIVTDPAAPRACAIEVSATPQDLSLMDAGLRIIEGNGPHIARSRQTTGFSCIMHRVTLNIRGLDAIAACDRMVHAGQVWLSFQLEMR